MRVVTVTEKDDYLLDVLVDLGHIKPKQVAKARATVKRLKTGAVEYLLRNRTIAQSDIALARSAHFGCEVAVIRRSKLTPKLLRIIPGHIARKYRVIPIEKLGNSLVIATADPSDLNTVNTLTHLLDTEITLRVTTEADMETLLAEFYPPPSRPRAGDKAA